MIYFIDIDNTLCKTVGEDYGHAKPFKGRIKVVNHLYDEGHKIVLVTARGWVSGLNWMPLTEKQVQVWGIKHHDLRPKPYFDVFVDDKATSDKDFFK